MKLSTFFLTCLLGLGIAFSIFKLFNGHGGSGLGDFMDGMGYTSLIIFFTALTILILNFKTLKKHFDTLLFLLLGLPMTVMAVGELIQNSKYNWTANPEAKYPRPITEKEFAKDSLIISVQIDSLVALKNRETYGTKIVYALIDTIIYSQNGSEIFVVYAKQFEPNKLGNDIDPAYLSADTRDSVYWHLREGPPNAEQMSGSYHNIADLKKAVRKFYFNQYSFLKTDSLKENYFWKRKS